MKRFGLVVILLSIIISGCAALGPMNLYLENGGMETLHGMKMCVQGINGTRIYTDATNTLYAFSWIQSHDRIGFVVIDYANKSVLQTFAQVTGGKGSLTDYTSWADLADDLVAVYGWREIPSSALPTDLIMQIGSTTSWIQAMSTTYFPTFVLVFPQMDFEGNPLNIPKMDS
jgi:hypothetical protein